MKAEFEVGDKVKITNNNKVYSTYTNSFILNSVSNKLFKMFESGYVPHNNTFADVVAVGKHEWGHNIYFIKENGHVSIIGEPGIELVESTDKIAINRYGNKVVAKMGNKVGVAKYNETDTSDLYTGVKIAVDRLFGKESEFKNSEVREAKRHAKVGEYIKIVKPSVCTFDEYKNGDILIVVKRDNYSFVDGRAYYKNKSYKYASLNEYVVLENYKPQEEPKEEKPKYYNGKAVCVEKSCTCDLYTVGKIYEFKNGITINDFDYESNHYTSIKDFNTRNSGDYKIIELVEDK